MIPLIPDDDDEPIAVIFDPYDDWYRRDVGQLVLQLVNQYEPWELAVVIAAEAVYAESLLCPN